MTDQEADKTQQYCPVHLEFGRKLIKANQLGTLTTSAIVELDAFADDYVDVYAGGKLVARGRPITVDRKLGVRVQEVLSVRLSGKCKIRTIT